MKTSNLWLPTLALLFAAVLLVNGSNKALAIRHGNALSFIPEEFAGEVLTGAVSGITRGIPGFDPNFDYNNPDPTAFERDWHKRNSWLLDSSHHEDGVEHVSECTGGETSTCGQGTIIPGLPSNYNPDYSTVTDVTGFTPGLLANTDFPTTPIDRNDPFDPNASLAFNNAHALGPNPGRMLRTRTEKGPFATFALDNPFIAQRAAIGGRRSPSVAELDTYQPIVYVINHDIFLPVDLDNVADNGGRQDGFRIGDYDPQSASSVLELRSGDLDFEGRAIVGSRTGNSRGIFTMKGGSLSIGTPDESTPNIQGGLLDNFRDGKLYVGIGGGGNADGIFNQEAGSVSVSGGLHIGENSFGNGTVGTYNMSPGTTLTLHRLGGDETSVAFLGDSGESLSTFNQNGGTVTVDADIQLGRHRGVLSAFGSAFSVDPGKGIWNVVGVSTTAGDFDLDGDVDGADFLLWQRDTGVGNLADWEQNYGSSAGGGSTTTLNQGVSTTVDTGTGASHRGELIVGNAGFGELNIDSSNGDVVVDTNAILVAAQDTFTGDPSGGAAPSEGLVNVIGENATITTGSLMVGDGAATFRFESASSISSIDVVVGHKDPLNAGDVDIDGAALIVDLLSSPPPAGDLLLIAVGGALTGEFTGLGEGAAVPGTGGYTISYLFGDGNDIGLIAPSAIAAVPEPTTMMLCLLAAVGVACTRKR